MTRALILLTALPPTVGHGHLISWAAHFLKASGATNPQIYVLVCTQPGEPLITERFEAVSAFCLKVDAAPVHPVFLHATMPQYPKGDDDPEFWATWSAEITRKCGAVDVVFSSEDYGNPLAASLNAMHIPADIERLTHNVRATDIRENPVLNFRNILPEFRRHVAKVVTVFGAESIGKTTVSKEMDGDHVTEWARPYLESLSSPEVTDERMSNIVTGQFASQMAARENIRNPIIVQDTDLLSTIGYYRVYTTDYLKDENYLRCVLALQKSRSDLYIVLKSNIPFTIDALRYGGDHRETSDQFWLDLLREFGCKHEVIGYSDHAKRLARATELSMDLFMSQPIWSFERDKEVKRAA